MDIEEALWGPYWSREIGHGCETPVRASHPLSAGYISARWAPNTVYPTMPMAEFFQTDAVINTANSGGPMFNMALPQLRL